LFVAIVAIGLDVALVGCSSDKPPPSGVGPTGNDGQAPGEASTRSDSSTLGDAADAAVDQIVFMNGPCVDDKPAPELDGGMPLCPTTGDCAGYCANIRDHYKLGVAQLATACILKLASCATPSDVSSCLGIALGNVCADSTAAPYCTSFVKTCDPNAGALGSTITQEGCVSLARGLSASGRSAFLGCVQSKIDAGTCPVEFVTCDNEIHL